ncbi:MAG TPA: Hpt domain-containing protein [Nitrospiraceae bacterium]|jgi:HPt (histidine-containing phosphotransfer) domain-containing protein|nr:Hpt domain-containing protein [Nitrospiraceae bacterium]
MSRPNTPPHEKIVVRLDPDLKPLIPRFLENRRKDLAAIQAALQREDFEEIRLLGHRMRGDGGGYGFHTISEIGTALERASAHRDAGEISRHADALLAFLDRVEVVY